MGLESNGCGFSSEDYRYARLKKILYVGGAIALFFGFVGLLIGLLLIAGTVSGHLQSSLEGPVLLVGGILLITGGIIAFCYRCLNPNLKRRKKLHSKEGLLENRCEIETITESGPTFSVPNNSPQPALDKSTYQLPSPLATEPEIIKQAKPLLSESNVQES